MKPVLAEHIDTLVLGCTHYPLIKALLQDMAGDDVFLVDSAEAMADITADLLDRMNLWNPERRPPEYKFFITDVPYRFQTIGERFLGRTLENINLVKL